MKQEGVVRLGCDGAAWMVAAAVACLFIPLIGPVLAYFALGYGVGGLLLELTGIEWLVRPPSDQVRARAQTLRSQLMGDCPACGRRVTVKPPGIEFTWHCSQCSAPLRYHRGKMTAAPHPEESVEEQSDITAPLSSP